MTKVHDGRTRISNGIVRRFPNIDRSAYPPTRIGATPGLIISYSFLTFFLLLFFFCGIAHVVSRNGG